MPPRKSDAAKAAAAAAPASDPASPGQSDEDKPKGRGRVNVDDNTLPKSIVTRLAKGNVPSNTQIQKDAVTALSRSATVFINYLASMANDITKMNGKKTIMPQHVIDAIDQIEFPGLKERLNAEWKNFDSIQSAKRSKAKDRKLEADTTGDLMSEDESARPSKRQRKSIANDKPDEDDGAVTEGNILEEGSQDDEDEAGEEGEDGEEGEESGEESSESGEEGESGDGELEDGMEDTVEDIDRDDQMEQDEDDEALDDGSDSD